MSSCITTTTVINNCDNPIERLLNSIISTGDLDSFERILDKGLVTAQCGCCPCPENGDPSLYFLGSGDTYLSLLYAFLGNDIENMSCCSSFNESIDDLSCYLKSGPIRIEGIPYTNQFEYLLDQVLVEHGLINGQSQLSIILNWYNSNLTFLLSKKIYLIEILYIILQKGIVVTCNEVNERSVIASLETYLKLSEALSISGEIQKTCCINILGAPDKLGNIKNILENGITYT